MRGFYAIGLCLAMQPARCIPGARYCDLFGQLPPQSRLTLREVRPLFQGCRTTTCAGADAFVFQRDAAMKIHIGFDVAFECVQPTPMIFMVNVHPSRAADLLTSDRLRVTPACPSTTYIDGFGNRCTRLLAPAGELRVATD